MSRQIVLDTETTGMNQNGVIYEGHRIIEIGCVEVIDRKLTGNNYHIYIKPDRLVDPEAIEVHGITDEMLADKPSFNVIAHEFIEYIRGADLVIHNASFDVSFMDHEFRSNGIDIKTADICGITDTLAMAKKLFPGKRNNLDVLCSRYGIDNSHRTLHGALLDAEILADVYLLMTGGQTALNLASDGGGENTVADEIRRINTERPALKVLAANNTELQAHEERLAIVKQEGGSCLWLND